MAEGELHEKVVRPKADTLGARADGVSPVDTTRTEPTAAPREMSMQNPTMPAVVLGGAVAALSVARSLWQSGVRVDLLADGLRSPARHSRALRRYLPPADAEAVTDGWITWLLNESEPAAILPCSDEGVEFIARRRGELEAAGHRPWEANDEGSLNMLDKAGAYVVARAAEVGAPQTVTLTNLTELARLDFPFPCGIKPVYAHRFARQFKTAAKGVTVATAEHARRVLTPILKEGHPMLLTEVIPGPDDQYRSYFTYLDEHGEPLLTFTKRKLRQYPTHFGLGSYHLTEWNPDVARLGFQFARAAGLRGLVNIEFKRDPRDGELKLIECNPRFTEVTGQVRAAGIDLALVAYNRLFGLPLPPLDSFKDHLAMWYPVDDIRAFREYRRQGELTTAAWLRTLAHRQVPLIFSWRDPKPSLHIWRARTHALARKASRSNQVPPQADDGKLDPYEAAI
ncbi:MAG: D-aspartate ligase [Solirubrobacterales bacterium]|jgi:D-aspartate ligase|nr:D-aspartate ligase [Solirubrobacterales bacterium]